MLEQLATERAHGRTRNLLVAATATGKTVVAAFDYRDICRLEGDRPMNIVWMLETPLPARLFREFSVLRCV